MARQSNYGPRNYSNLGGYQQKLGARNYTLAADISDFVADTKNRMDRLVVQSAEDLINQVQTPVAKGGKMRVDTGFLRASGQVSLDGMPTGPGIGEKGQTYDWKPFSIASIVGFKLGQTIYFGWTANYAKYREAYDGFLISGIQNWQSIVTRNCDKIRKQYEQRKKAAGK